MKPAIVRRRTWSRQAEFPRIACDRIGAGLTLVVGLLWAVNVAADPILGETREFLREHCGDCHGGGGEEGGFRLETLGADLAEPRVFAAWERLHDRVADGEMPPEEAWQPDNADRGRFLESLGTALTEAHAAAKGTVLRRLNRQEYENTLNDLFGTRAELVPLLPEDGRSHEFNNVGEALSLSDASNPNSAGPTARSSRNTSPRSANSNHGYKSPRTGSGVPSRRSTRNRPRISTIRPTRSLARS